MFFAPKMFKKEVNFFDVFLCMQNSEILSDWRHTCKILPWKILDRSGDPAGAQKTLKFCLGICNFRNFSKFKKLISTFVNLQNLVYFSIYSIFSPVLQDWSDIFDWFWKRKSLNIVFLTQKSIIDLRAFLCIKSSENHNECVNT